MFKIRLDTAKDSGRVWVVFTTCRLHQTLATNNLALLASGLKMIWQEHKDGRGDAAADTTGPMAAADASQAPESPPHAAASAVPATRRAPARGKQCLPVSLVLNSAPTRAAVAEPLHGGVALVWYAFASLKGIPLEFHVSTSTWPNAADSGREHVITDALQSVVVWRRVISSDWKKFSTCTASKQFIVPCPIHALDVLIWKIIALEPRKSFRCLFLYCKRVDPEWSLQDILLWWMFCVGIAAAKMNCLKGSLYNFASATHGFLLHYTFQASQSNSVRRTVVHKTFDSSSSQMLRHWFLGCSPWNYWDRWKAALHLLLASV